VVPVLRFIGLLNAAVWLGAMIFFTFAVGPTFFTPEVKSLVGAPRAGVIAQMVLERYFILQQWCSGIALVHLLAEWLYFNRLNSKASLWILLICLGVSLLAERELMPKMKQLHLVKYAVQTSDEQKKAAERSFSILHATSMITNLLMLGGVLFYYWRLSHGNQGGKSSAGVRFR
jgi:hypothetical protein